MRVLLRVLIRNHFLIDVVLIFFGATLMTCDGGSLSSSRAFQEPEDLYLFSAFNGTNRLEEPQHQQDEPAMSASDIEQVPVFNASNSEPVGVDRNDRVVRFLLYTERNKELLNGTQIYIGNKTHLLQSGFNITGPVKIICHGYMSSYKRGPGKLLIPAYFNAWKGRGLNIISVNWSAMSGLLRTFYDILYFPPARNTEFVGNETAAMISFLVKDLGIELSRFHLIGHSLGAHAMGYAGRSLKRTSGNSVARITALDPAGPCFETFRRACFRGKFQPIGRGDAGFVDAIHTHAWALGMKKPVGDVDFYPNGGFTQPGCFKLSWGICSHKRAIELMEESILNNGFEIRAYRCNDMKSLSREACNEHSNDFALLGEPCSTSSKGIYFLKTNSKKPFITLLQNITHLTIRF